MLAEIENPSRVTSAEIVVGIPSYNEADSIYFPVEQASKGLMIYYPHKSSVIVNVDNCSPDGTKDAFLSTPTKVPKIYASTPEGIKGKGRNVRNLLEVSAGLGAKAVILLTNNPADPDGRSRVSTSNNFPAPVRVLRI